MKKFIFALLTILMLCACGNGSYAKLSDGSDVIFKGPDCSFTKDDLNQTIKMEDYANVVLSDIIVKLAKSEDVDIEAIEEEAQETIDTYEESGMTYYLEYYYGSVDNYKRNYVANEIITVLETAEIENNIDTYVDDYKPFKAEIATFSTEEECNAVLAKVAEGTTFSEACAENNYSAAVETLYSDKDETLPLEIKDYVLNTDVLGVSTIISCVSESTDEDGNTTETTIYYLVNVIDKDEADFHEEFISLILQDYSSDDFVNELLEKHDITFYDQRTYELCASYYEVLE